MLKKNILQNNAVIIVIECEAKSFYSPDNIQREIYKELGDVQFDAFQQSSSNMLISNERMSLSPLFGQKVVVLKV
ncbi:MAG: hypothetical protein ACOX1Z_02140 [Candidatus Ratteibacteria bacterium]